MLIVMLSVCGIVCIVRSCVMFAFICFMSLTISGCGMLQHWLCHVLELDALMSLASFITLYLLCLAIVNLHVVFRLDDSMSSCLCVASYIQSLIFCACSCVACL